MNETTPTQDAYQTGPSPPLPHTGFDASPLIVMAFVLIAIGVLLTRKLAH